jgi:hypothetical protein
MSAVDLPKSVFSQPGSRFHKNKKNRATKIDQILQRIHVACSDRCLTGILVAEEEEKGSTNRRWICQTVRFEREQPRTESGHRRKRPR